MLVARMPCAPSVPWTPLRPVVPMSHAHALLLKACSSEDNSIIYVLVRAELFPPPRTARLSFRLTLSQTGQASHFL